MDCFSSHQESVDFVWKELITLNSESLTHSSAYSVQQNLTFETSFEIFYILVADLGSRWDHILTWNSFWYHFYVCVSCNTKTFIIFRRLSNLYPLTKVHKIERRFNRKTKLAGLHQRNHIFCNKFPSLSVCMYALDMNKFIRNSVISSLTCILMPNARYITEMITVCLSCV